jgi:TonB-linked SusC/RagA family outer membrane protein
MIKLCTYLCSACFLVAFNFNSVAGKPLQTDTIRKPTHASDTLGRFIRKTIIAKGGRDSVNLKVVALSPNISLQQAIKGNVPGVYVNEASGEPGAIQSMVIQGLSSPVFNRKDIFDIQPAIYVNGIPLIQDNSLVYDVQKYDYNKIGPATNLLAGLNINNIASIEILKDPVSLAKLGPIAANGAIWVVTKSAKSGFREIDVNTYFGTVLPSRVSTVNGVFERNFRQPFYDKFATTTNVENSAAYLKDETNLDYFGKSNWNDLYYRAAPLISADLSLTGGSDRANFRFFGAGSKTSGNSDETNLNKYNASFIINMAPFKWFTISSMVNAARLDRTRNRSLRDRAAETRYLPDFSNPLSPDKSNYQQFLDEYKKAIDDNLNNVVQGSFSLNFKLNKLRASSTLFFDYNEGIRDTFFPTTLMEGVNFVSNYFGFNQRFKFNNSLIYEFDLDGKHRFDLELGQSIQSDVNKYNYARAYNGPNDFIKINVVNGSSGSGSYLTSDQGFYVFRYTDRSQNKLLSFYGSAKYNYGDQLSVNAVLRYDGSSNGQPDSRWVIAPAVSVNWDMKKGLMPDNKLFDALNVDLSWGRTARLFNDDRFAAGPQYRTEYGWSEEPTIIAYNGHLGVNRPYTSGWVGYGITAPYTDRLNLGLTAAFMNKRVHSSLFVYNKDDRNLLINMPVPSETGYSSKFENGMWINNKGIELSLNADVFQNVKALNWSTGFNFNFNKNVLKALPNGNQELVVGSNLLKVGHSVGSYWLYENKGTINSASDIPVNPANNKATTFNGIPLSIGDPIWTDVNGDYIINEDDKVLKGDRMPEYTGGWNNTLSYGAFSLNVNVFFAIGQKALNKFDASRYNFVYRESVNDINSIKEINAWQTQSKMKTYPVYNPWSNVIAYRDDQDLFLENTSYLKLRSATLGYDLMKRKVQPGSKTSFRKALVYLTASNLLTITKFSGADPELVDLSGMYDGSGLSIPQSFVLGLQLSL